MTSFNSGMPAWKQAMYQHKQAQPKVAQGEPAPLETLPVPTEGNGAAEKTASNDNDKLITPDLDYPEVKNLVENGNYTLAELLIVQNNISINVVGSGISATVQGADDINNNYFVSEADNCDLKLNGGNIEDNLLLEGETNTVIADLAEGNDELNIGGTRNFINASLGEGSDFVSLYGEDNTAELNLGEGSDTVSLSISKNLAATISMDDDTESDVFSIQYFPNEQTDNHITLNGDSSDSLEFQEVYQPGPPDPPEPGWPKDNTFFKFTGSNVIEYGNGNSITLNGVDNIKITFDLGNGQTEYFEGTYEEFKAFLNPPTGPDPSEVYNYISTNPSIHDHVGGPMQPNVGDASKHYWNFDLKNGNDVFNPYISTMQNKFVTIDAGTGNDSIYFTNSQYKNNEVDVKLGEGADKFFLGKVKEHTGSIDFGNDTSEDLFQLSHMGLQQDNHLTLTGGDINDLVGISSNELATITNLTQGTNGEWLLEYGNNNSLTIPADMKIRVGNTDRTLQEFMDYLEAQSII